MGGSGKLVPMDAYNNDEGMVDEAATLRRLCYILGMSVNEWHQLRATISRSERRCNTFEEVLRRSCCSANQLYSQITIDDLSDKNRIELNQIRTGLGDPYVDTFPVPPTKKIRLLHLARPGYTPTKVMIDFNLANAGDNYLDLSVQFFLVSNDTDPGRDLGSTYSGNDFLNKDGTQIHIPFPTYRGKVVDVGSLERMAVEITHTGAVNALNSARVRLFYDSASFYEACKMKCEGDCDDRPAKPKPVG